MRTYLNQSERAAIIDLLKNGRSLVGALAEIGIKTHVYYNTFRSDPTFVAEINATKKATPISERIINRLRKRIAELEYRNAELEGIIQANLIDHENALPTNPS